jgi:cell division inhibitor SulA/protein ImuA
MQHQIRALLLSPHVWRGSDHAHASEVESTQLAELDRILPGGGWPRHSLIEILHGPQGVGELAWLLPTLADRSTSTRIALVMPPHVPYAPALFQAGIQPWRLIVVEPGTAEDGWWSAEQMLRSGQFGAIIFWPQRFDERGLRRLHAACRQGTCLGFVMHAESWACAASPAPLRLCVMPSGEVDAVRFRILKCRGGFVTADRQYVLRIRRTRANAVMTAVPLQASAHPPLPRTAATGPERGFWPEMAPGADTLRLSTAPAR